MGSHSRPLGLELGDEELGDALVLRVGCAGVGQVGLVTAGTEFLLKGQPHDGRVGGVLLLLADLGGLVLAGVVEKDRRVARARRARRGNTP